MNHLEPILKLGAAIIIGVTLSIGIPYFLLDDPVYTECDCAVVLKMEKHFAPAYGRLIKNGETSESSQALIYLRSLANTCRKRGTCDWRR